jgi:hypothetical protein
LRVATDKKSNVWGKKVRKAVRVPFLCPSLLNLDKRALCNYKRVLSLPRSIIQE